MAVRLRLRTGGVVGHRTFAGHPKVHEVSVARIPKDVFGRLVSAEHPSQGRPAGQGNLPGRSADDPAL
jgi:hypothetical protein